MQIRVAGAIARLQTRLYQPQLRLGALKLNILLLQLVAQMFELLAVFVQPLGQQRLGLAGRFQLLGQHLVLHGEGEQVALQLQYISFQQNGRKSLGVGQTALGVARSGRANDAIKTSQGLLLLFSQWNITAWALMECFLRWLIKYDRLECVIADDVAARTTAIGEHRGS